MLKNLSLWLDYFLIYNLWSFHQVSKKSLQCFLQNTGDNQPPNGGEGALVKIDASAQRESNCLRLDSLGGTGNKFLFGKKYI